jgi:hypothetical protein
LSTSYSQGYNLSDDSTCEVLTQTSDLNNVVKGAGLDPQGLQNNGGPTPTLALLPTSPAVDHIPASVCSSSNGYPATDQRGITRPQGAGCDGGAYELVQTVPFSSFSAQLALSGGSSPGFDLKATLALGSGSNGIDPLGEAVTLQIGSYTVTLPPGSLHQLQNGSKADAYVYAGTLNGVALQIQMVPLGGSTYQFKAEGSPVNLTGSPNPVPVTLTIGNDTGTITVAATLTGH